MEKDVSTGSFLLWSCRTVNFSQFVYITEIDTFWNWHKWSQQCVCPFRSGTLSRTPMMASKWKSGPEIAHLVSSCRSQFPPSSNSYHSDQCWCLSPLTQQRLLSVLSLCSHCSVPGLYMITVDQSWKVYSMMTPVLAAPMLWDQRKGGHGKTGWLELPYSRSSMPICLQHHHQPDKQSIWAAEACLTLCYCVLISHIATDALQLALSRAGQVSRWIASYGHIGHHPLVCLLH